MSLLTLRNFLSKLCSSRIYLDYAATTPIDGDVLAVMNRTAQRYFANPGSLHTDSRQAAQLVEDSRAQMRKLLHAFNHDIVFTRGGTEACNIGVRHALARFGQAHPGVTPHVISSPIEHSSVHELCRYLAEQEIIHLEYAPTNEYGVVLVNKLSEMIRPETALVAVQLANSEVGIIQPVKKIAHIIRRHKHDAGSPIFPLLFTDAVQVGGIVDIHIQSLGVDYLALSASKFYGPKSGGVLCVPKGIRAVAGVLLGGDQELGIRPGTEDVSLVVGTAHAYGIACDRRKSEYDRLEQLRNYLYTKLQTQYPQCIVTIPAEFCAPHIAHIAIPHYDSDYAVLFFDKYGIDIASQSACTAHAGGVSRTIAHVWSMRDMHNPEFYAQLRFSFGRFTTQGDIDRAVIILDKLLHQTYVRS